MIRWLWTMPAHVTCGRLDAVLRDQRRLVQENGRLHAQQARPVRGARPASSPVKCAHPILPTPQHAADLLHLALLLHKLHVNRYAVRAARSVCIRLLIVLQRALCYMMTTLCGRNGSLDAAAQEFSAEQIAHLASRDAMRRVASIQAQLDALQQENENLKRRPAGPTPHRESAAELGALKQEVAELRAENASLREQQGAAAVQHHQADPVLQSQLSPLRRENAALRAQRLVADRLGSKISTGNGTGSKAADMHTAKAGVQDRTEIHLDAANNMGEVGQLQHLLEQANEQARSHESKAERLAAEVRFTTRMGKAERR